ncbi:MAG: hypothetical protein HC875_26305 [Anaerolineales bacterium]|nr:hypothetical protein [Anaerolineales bacterium]
MRRDPPALPCSSSGRARTASPARYPSFQRPGFRCSYTPERIWDRVYVTTLFTFYWKQTVEAIEFAKKIVKSIDSLYVGGVAASLIPDLFAQETGLSVGRNILVGLLDKSGILDDNKIIIDEITPDYSILETIEHHYPLDTGYLTYMTKGCTRTCSFCAVPKLEPIYKEKISIAGQIKLIAQKHGERKDLILMDNNVLGSPRFPEIIQEILDMGFEKGAKFVEPNYFMILTEYLLNGDSELNERKYLEKVFNLLMDFGKRRIKRVEIQKQYYQLLHSRGLDSFGTFKKENLLDVRTEINEFIEVYRNKLPKYRYIDFNQGIDCRYVNEENMKLLSQLPIRPMRIAFDHISLREPYEKAIRLADKYGVRTLSNYILFNYKDKPADLWNRLKINLDLNIELESTVYSFPMKFIPLYGDDSKDRTYIGTHWNRKYIRAIQSILNATGGVVTVNPEFFNRAFGKDIEEFFKILMMPEDYIIYRDHFENDGKTEQWFYQFKNLNADELKHAESIIHSNDFFSFNGTTPKVVIEVMKHYQVRYKADPINV